MTFVPFSLCPSRTIHDGSFVLPDFMLPQHFWSALGLLSLSSPHFRSFFFYLQVCELESWCGVVCGGGVNLKEQPTHRPVLMAVCSNCEQMLSLLSVKLHLVRCLAALMRKVTNRIDKLVYLPIYLK